MTAIIWACWTTQIHTIAQKIEAIGQLADHAFFCATARGVLTKSMTLAPDSRG
jgi:hypothetical protein